MEEIEEPVGEPCMADYDGKDADSLYDIPVGRAIHIFVLQAQADKLACLFEPSIKV
jgi:hypothetical protein